MIENYHYLQEMICLSIDLKEEIIVSLSIGLLNKKIIVRTSSKTKSYFRIEKD
jgi:hypothetical protein